MVWLRIDSNVPKQKKFVNAGPVAAWLWLSGVAHCRTALTDGFIQKALVPTLVPNMKASFRHAERLVEVGLWHHVLGGYEVNGYLEWNPSKSEVERLRRIDLERKKGRRADPDSDLESAWIPNDAPSRGRELSLSSPSGSAGDEERKPLSAFEQFWKAYPAKVGKGAAEKAFVKNARLLDVMLASIERHKHSQRWLKNNGEFIPNPATWLNQRRWEDEIGAVAREARERVDWSEECAEKHGGRCGNAFMHDAEMAKVKAS